MGLLALPGHILDVPCATLLCTVTALTSRPMIRVAAALFVSIQLFLIFYVKNALRV